MSIFLKSTLRAAALARRDALSDGQRHDAAHAIAAHADVFDLKPGTVVAGYIPMRNEIDPRPLMLRLAARGARLALPTVTGAMRRWSFARGNWTMRWWPARSAPAIRKIM